MLKINRSLFFILLVSNHTLARSYEDTQLVGLLNKRGYKYFANHLLKELKQTKDLTYKEHFESLYILNLVNEIDNKYESARLEKLIANSKVKNEKLCYALAKTYEQRDDFKKSLELYNQLSPNDETNLKKVCLNIINGNLDDAQEILKDVSENFENEKNFYKGLINFYKKEFDQALNAFDFIKDDPKFEEKVPCLIAQCYVEQKKYLTVINYVKKLEKNQINFENKTDVYRIAGDAALLKKKYEEAIDFYNKALYATSIQYYSTQQTTLAPAPLRQQLDVINLDDIDEIADIENNETENVEEEQPKEKIVKKEKQVEEKQKVEKKDEIKVEIEKPAVEAEEEIIEDEEEVEEEIEEEPVFNIYDELGMRLGFAYYKNGKFEEAKTIWQRVSNCKPTLFQMANYYTGIVSLKEKKNEEALNAFNKAREIVCKSEIQPEILFYCAALYYNNQEFNIAKELIKNFKRSFSEHKLVEQIDDLNFKIATNENNYETIISDFEKIKNKTDKQKTLFQKALLFNGNELFNKSKYSEAVRVYEKSLDEGISFKLNNDAYFGLAECFTYLKDYNRALTEYRNIDISSDKYPRAILGIAYIQFNSQKYDLALKNFSVILRNYKNRFDTKTLANVKNRIADCLLIQRKYQEALKLYQANSNDHSYFYQGIIYDTWNNSSQALNCFQKIDKTSSYYEKALLEIGTIYLSCCQFTKAKETFTKFITDYPNSKFLGDVILKRATANVSLKNFDQAQKDYRTFLNTFPGDPNTSHALANLLEITKDENQRRELIGKYKNKFKISSLSFNDGKNAFYEQNYDKAIGVFEKFISENKNDKNFDEACYLLAEAYRINKEIEKSLRNYEILANKEKSDFYIKSLIKLGTIYKARKEHENAIRYFEKLKAKSRSSRDKIVALNGLMTENFIIQNFEQAITFANECLNLKVENPNIFVDANMIIMRCRFELKNFDQVVRNCNTFAKDERFKEVQDEILFLKAECLYELKRHDESLNALFDLTKNFQNSRRVEESYIVMAQNYIAQNKITQANQTLDSIIKNSNDEKLKERARSLKVERKNK